jgi:uncharacterized protein (DUF427 family)
MNINLIGRLMGGRSAARPVPVPPGPGQESVWDYPRPPIVEPVPERIRVAIGGRNLADSTKAFRVLETAGAPVYYVPEEDVDASRLRTTNRSTVCEWKGKASYFDYEDGDRSIKSVAWAYADPKPGFEAITGHVAFYASRVDEAWVGDERATPQPGGFYGGWVTSRIVGPFKGEPGSQRW